MMLAWQSFCDQEFLASTVLRAALAKSWFVDTTFHCLISLLQSFRVNDDKITISSYINIIQENPREKKVACAMKTDVSETIVEYLTTVDEILLLLKSNPLQHLR